MDLVNILSQCLGDMAIWLRIPEEFLYKNILSLNNNIFYHNFHQKWNSSWLILQQHIWLQNVFFIYEIVHFAAMEPVKALLVEIMIQFRCLHGLHMHTGSQQQTRTLVSTCVITWFQCATITAFMWVLCVSRSVSTIIIVLYQTPTMVILFWPILRRQNTEL